MKKLIWKNVVLKICTTQIFGYYVVPAVLGLEFSYPPWTDGIEVANGIGGQIKTCIPFKNSSSSKGIWKTFHQLIHGHITADFSSYYTLCCRHLFILRTLLLTSLHTNHITAVLQKPLKWQNTVCG